MNYISEINQFYDWLETNPVSDSAIALWHALMHINNKCGWKPEFSVSISTIQNKTGLSKSSILRARTALSEAGRITFASREGQKSAMYSLIACQGGAQSDTQSSKTAPSDTPNIEVARHTDTQSGTQTITQTEFVRQGDTQSDTQNIIARHTDTQTVTDLKLNNINKKGAEPFFTIGTNQILGKPSDRIKSDHSMVTDNFMMTIFRGLEKEKIFDRLDVEYMGYQFKDEMHLRNSFKTVGEKMAKESKPKSVYGKPEMPAASNEGFTSLQKPRGAVSHGK